MTIGEKLRYHMNQRGVRSANRLASLSGVAQTTISAILRDDSVPSTSTLLLLCKALEITEQDFFRGVSITDPGSPSVAEQDDHELLELRERLRRQPELRTLFSATKKATKEDLLKAVRIIEALKDDGRDDD